MTILEHHRGQYKGIAMKLKELFTVLPNEENISITLWHIDASKLVFIGKVREYLPILKKDANYRWYLDYTVFQISRDEKDCCINIDLKEVSKR